VHDVLRTGFDQSPMFQGRIQGRGPRYCPSIEDKIERFADKERHQLFVEPEGRNTIEIYVNGFSSSLPEDVQYKALRLIPGFEDVKMFRPGYAIEYDYFPPTQLKMSLETHLVQGLFFAGQINGTTGYEEAACQGLMAGINAARYVQELEPFILSRSDAYIGVLIDDLINKGTNEPYRMFTSRAEFRILLRQDNADIRLTPLAQNLGMTDMEDRMERVNHKNKALSEITDWFKTVSGDPDYLNTYLESVQSAPLKQKIKLDQIITRPNVQINDMAEYFPPLKEMLQPYDSEVIQLAETQMKYEAYIQKEMEMVSRVNKLEDMKLSTDFDYSTISSLSLEAREKLNKHKPTSLGQAGRISGINPADISVLLIHLRPG
ncbi:MAG TPA: FAD-dependent oxidoreductase, partial [Saprospiraceae bacterium]|nr:FAD-dependent oxidoreductase [Saprospiraceae bacterium]